MSSQEAPFRDFDVTMQAWSRATRERIASLVRPWLDDPAVVPLATPDRSAVIASMVEAKVRSAIFQPSMEERAPYAEWRIDKLVAGFLEEQRSGTWSAKAIERVQRPPYWNTIHEPYINNEKLVLSVAPPVHARIVEWVGVGFCGKPGVGKTTKMSWLAALIEAVYRRRGDDVSIHYTNKLAEAVESLNHSTVQIIIVDDASLFQHARQSMTRENIDVIKSLDVIRHRFEEKVGKTGVIVTMFAVQRYKGLDLGIRDLTRCFVWSGLTTEEDLEDLPGPSRSFLNQQERAFEHHDLSARLYGLVTGLAGEEFLMRADLAIAQHTFERLSSAFAERRVVEQAHYKKSEEFAKAFMERELHCRAVLHEDGDANHTPDLTLHNDAGALNYVNVKNLSYAGRTSQAVSHEDCGMEIDAARRAGLRRFYIFMLDKDSGQVAVKEFTRLNAKTYTVSLGELKPEGKVRIPQSLLAFESAKAKPGSGPTGSVGVPTPLTRDLSKLDAAMDTAIDTVRKAVIAGDGQRAIESMMTVGPILQAVEGDTSPGAEAIRKKWRDFGNEKVRRDSFQTRETA